MRKQNRSSDSGGNRPLRGRGVKRCVKDPEEWRCCGNTTNEYLKKAFQLQNDVKI